MVYIRKQIGHLPSLPSYTSRQTDDKGCSFSLLSEGTSLYMTVNGNELSAKPAATNEACFSALPSGGLALPLL